MKPFVPGRPHWWQWPTILSLDAPLVAMGWQWLLARVARVPLGWHHVAILGLSVWLAYVADRWIEGWRLVPDQIRTQRHHFYQRWRGPLAVIGLAALAVDLALAGIWLSRREFTAGLVLLGPTTAYLLSHQLVHRHHRWRAPKEVCVAALLSGGVAVFPAAAPGIAWGALAVPLVFFGLLCFANCALISVWEQAVDEAHGQTSLALQFRKGHGAVRALPWLIALATAVLAFDLSGPRRTAFVCATVSGLLLGLVDLAERRAGPRLARALADIALMSPLAVLLFEVFWF